MKLNDILENHNDFYYNLPHEELLQRLQSNGMIIGDIINSFIYNREHVPEDLLLAAVENTGIAYFKINSSNINIPPDVTKFAVEKWGWPITVVDNPSPALVKLALTCEPFIRNEKLYHDYVTLHVFPNNSVMANKWLRYGENIRDLK
jgi:hypothetical protein